MINMLPDNNLPFPAFSGQHGAALITSLIILLVLTVLGVSAMSSSSLQELMAGNMRDQNLSFQAAEAALRDGERTVSGWGGNAPSPNNTGSNRGVFTPFDANDPAFDFGDTAYNMSFWGAATAYSLSSLGTASAPLYIIEEQQFVPKDASYKALVRREGKHFYRITSRGEGASANAVTLLQETTARRFK